MAFIRNELINKVHIQNPSIKVNMLVWKQKCLDGENRLELSPSKTDRQQFFVLTTQKTGEYFEKAPVNSYLWREVSFQHGNES